MLQIYINLNLNWVWRTRLTSLVLQSKSIVLKKNEKSSFVHPKRNFKANYIGLTPEESIIA